MNEIATAITLLTVNLIVLSIVIVAMMVATIVLVVKMNKIASNVQETTDNLVRATNWLSPVKVFNALAMAIRKVKKK